MQVITTHGVLGDVDALDLGLRRQPEPDGLVDHAESGYDLSPSTGGGASGAFALAGIGAAPKAPKADVEEETAPATEKVSG